MMKSDLNNKASLLSIRKIDLQKKVNKSLNIALHRLGGKFHIFWIASKQRNNDSYYFSEFYKAIQSNNYYAVSEYFNR